MGHPLLPPEEAFVRAFIVAERRERFLELLAKPKHRHKITESLAHPNLRWFDARFMKNIPPSQSSAVLIAKLLRQKGGGPTCWAISESSKLDAKEIDLDSVLSDVVGYGTGTILSCIPGKLAFVESEDGRFILER